RRGGDGARRERLRQHARVRVVAPQCGFARKRDVVDARREFEPPRAIEGIGEDGGSLAMDLLVDDLFPGERLVVFLQEPGRRNRARDLSGDESPVPAGRPVDVRGLHGEVAHVAAHLYGGLEPMLFQHVAEGEGDTGPHKIAEGATAGGEVWLVETIEGQGTAIAPRDEAAGGR